MSVTALRDGATILFQGDSITDAGRSRENDGALGSGYVNMIAAWLSAMRPEAGWRFLNRGIGGNRVYDMEERWTADCIDLKPDIVSILIGINDTWRRYDSNTQSPIVDFEASLRRVIERVKNETPARVMLLEPFVLPVTVGQRAWREDLDPRIHCVRDLARELETLYIPLDGLFAAAAAARPPAFWAADGVHPTQAGHALIAQAWIRAALRQRV